MPKFHPLSEDAFSQSESSMKFDKAGNGGFGFNLHTPSLKVGGKMQSPAQHASVKKAAAASVAKRKSGIRGLK